MTTPHADLIAPGTWWLRGTRGANVYLVEADDGSLVLVDTGFRGSEAAILRALDSVAPGRPLEAILLTHEHFDHVGAAAGLVARTGARIVAGRGDCDAAPGGGFLLRPHTGPTHHLRRLKQRFRPPPTPRALRVDVAVEDECEVAPGVCAVPTPGHTPGSLCFVVPSRGLAFAGDLVISHGGTLTRPLRSANADDAVYLQSMRTFAAAAPAAGFPGHGQPLLTGFDAALKQLAAFPRRRPGVTGYITRARRLAGFGRNIYRRR